jgi:riboflavin transporter
MKDSLPLILQGVSLLAIVLISWWSFKKFKLRFTTKTMIMLVVFVVLKQVLTYFSVMIPFFGFPSLRIGISQLPLMLGGVILGPAMAVVLGLISDVVGLIVTPTNYPFLGFTLNAVLAAWLPAIIFWRLGKAEKLSSQKAVAYVLAGLAGLISVVVLSLKEFKVDKLIIQLDTANRVIVLGGSILLIVLMGLVIIELARRKQQTQPYYFETWILAVLVVELGINCLMTPLWLQLMYGIPYLINLIPRIFKTILMLYVSGALGFALLKLLQRMKINE